MSEPFNQDDFNRLLRNAEERALAIGQIFDTAIETTDLTTLERILNTYPRKFLELTLGGYPDYLDEELGR